MLLTPSLLLRGPSAVQGISSSSCSSPHAAMAKMRIMPMRDAASLILASCQFCEGDAGFVGH